MTELRLRIWIRIGASLSLFFIPEFGDSITRIPRVQSCPTFLALTDTLVHATIGLLSWTIVEPESVFQPTRELIIVGVGSALIDIDHFLVARSFWVKDVLQNEYRGIFHCSGLFALLTLCILPFNLNYALVLLTIFVPHHLRDSTRRGLYLYFPYVHSQPLPEWLVQSLLVLFAWLIMSIRTKYGGHTIRAKEESPGFIV